jgi:hypothetical protein
MKKLALVSIVLVLVIGLVPAAIAQTPSEGTTSTSILVQNPSTSSANVVVDFYNTLGTKTGTKTNPTLGGEKSTTFDQRYDSGNPGTDPFQGAAIVSSDQPIGAVVQEVRTNGSGGVNSYEAYSGIGTAGKDIKAPLILKGVSSAGKVFNTFMSIQNTSLSASAHVTVTFSHDPNVPIGGTDMTANYTIPAGGSQYVNQKDQAGLGTAFYGSAAIASDVDVAVVVNNGASDGSSLTAYPTYAAGSTVVYLPGAMKNIPSLGDNYFTSLTIVNMGSSPVTVQIEYKPLSGTAGAAYTKVVTTSATIDQRYDTNITSASFTGAVVVTVQGSGTIAAMLNERGDDATGAAKYASTYGGFSSGVTTAYAPYLLKYISSAGYSWSSSILIENLDPTNGPLTVTITYNGDPTGTYPSSKVVTTYDFVDMRYDTNLTPATFYGGAKFTSDRPFGIVVLVRGSNFTGDALSSYLGIAP